VRGRDPGPVTGQIPLQEGSPAALAEEISRLPPTQRATRFRLLGKDMAAQVFDALDPAEQRDLIDGLRSPEVRRLIDEMEPDDRVRLLDEMPAIVARKMLFELSEQERELTNVLLGYPPESAGRMMSPHFLELRAEASVDQAMATIRERGRDIEALNILPVRDSQRRLEGAVRLTDLVRADPDQRVAEIVDRDYPALGADSDQETVARLMQEEDLLAIPIVDSEQRLVGIATVDDAMEVIELEETEDISRIAGASEPLGTPYHAVPIRRLVRTRIVWLLFLVAAASLTVTVLGAFESTLEQVVTLALFIPLLIGTGGNCGAQAATTVTRAIAVGDIRFSDLVPSILKEARVGLLLGLLFAVLGFPLITALWSADLAATVSLSLLAICTWATTVGAMLPLVSSRLGIDPAVVSAPLVTTLVDATGLLIYFAIAQLIMI
jgi:magnesium transporter